MPPFGQAETPRFEGPDFLQPVPPEPQQDRQAVRFQEKPDLQTLANLNNLEQPEDLRGPYTTADNQEVIPFGGWFASKLKGARDFITSVFSNEPRPFEMAQAANEANRNASHRAAGLFAERGFQREANRLLRNSAPTNPSLMEQANPTSFMDKLAGRAGIPANLMDVAKGGGKLTQQALGVLGGLLGARRSGYNGRMGAFA